MSSNKNQHFVPQSYLRRFSVDDRSKSLNVYHIGSGRNIKEASIKGQCSKNFFYGSDEAFESGMQKLEAEGAKHISKACILDESVDLSCILLFALFQGIRTDSYLKGQISNWREMRDVVYGDFEGDPRLYVPETPEKAAKETFSSLRKFYEVVSDLKCCVLTAPAGRGFITSDNPAFWVDRFVSQKKFGQMPGFGLSSAGVCIFLPLSPTVMFLAFDDNVYKCLPTGRWYAELSANDMDWLNVATAAHANNNLYHDSSVSPESVAAVFESSRNMRLDEKHSIHLLKRSEDKSRDGEGVYERVSLDEFRCPGESLLVTEVKHVAFKNWPKFMKYKLRPKFINTQTGEGLRRVTCTR